MIGGKPGEATVNGGPICLAIDTGRMNHAAKAGFHRQGWTEAGFPGDELPSGKYPDKELLNRALHNIQTGDVLLSHRGLRDHGNKFVNVLDELLAAQQDKGFHSEHLPAKQA